MSKIIASAGIRGAHAIIERVEEKWKKAMDEHGGNQEVAYPNTGYFLPIIYGMTGFPVKKLEDMRTVLDKCQELISGKKPLLTSVGSLFLRKNTILQV